MNDELPIEKPKPISLCSPAERYAHVVKRMRERGGIDWTPDQVRALETKIEVVRKMISSNKPVAPILPTMIGEDHGGGVLYYRVWIAGAPVTFVWSNTCNGLISYRGAGELGQLTIPK